MALIERPADWHFIIPLPDANDLNSKILKSWTLELKEPISYVWREFLLTSPLNLTATSCRTSEGADVSVEIKTEVATECRRCCAPLTVAIQEKFMYSYIRQSVDEKFQEEEEFYDSDRVVIPVTSLGANLDVTDLAWECLVVSLPVHVACPNGCADIDSLLPVEDRRDPRLLALADLLSEEKQKEGNNNG